MADSHSIPLEDNTQENIRAFDENGEPVTAPTVDAEFKSLIPALSAEERAQLEANLIADGCRDAVVVWRAENVLVDGHNRLEICAAHGIRFSVKYMDFADRAEAIVWVCRNQLGRRNLADYARGELALRMKSAIAEKAKENQATSGVGVYGGKPLLLNSTKAVEAINTRAELAKVAETSEDTIRKIEKIATGAPEVVKNKARKGDISTNRAHEITIALKAFPKATHNRVVELCDDVVEKYEILAKLYKSSKTEGSNDTYGDVVNSGGFHYGDSMEKWCDWRESKIVAIKDALKTLAENHRRIEAQRKRQDQIEKAQAAIAETPSDDYGIRHADMTTLFDALEDNSVDLFFTDPPYDEGAVKCYADLARLAAAKLKPGGLCVAYSGHMHLLEVMNAMQKHLCYWWLFAIDHRQGFTTIWNRRVMASWKPVVVFAKPLANGTLAPSLEQVTDFFGGGRREKAHHEWGQAQSEAEYWISQLCAPGSLVCDPFVGGGTTPAACHALSRRFIGTEINSEHVTIARARLAEMRGAA